MKAAQLNTRIDIQFKIKTADESGATVEAWQPLGRFWADVRHISGTESIRADVLADTVKASIRIRFNPAVTAAMRVVLPDGAVYDIKAVLPDLRTRRYTDLVCERTG